VLEALRRQEYDVILMDIQMPEMEGLESSKRICSQRPKESPPWIIAMTAKAVTRDKERCLKAGMDAYLSRPVQVQELQEVLKLSWEQVTERKNGSS
jgi:CheY-like chemotaxis protein